MKTIYTIIIFSLLLLILSTSTAFGKHKPDWLAVQTPQPSNSSFSYKVVDNISVSPEEAINGCFNKLIGYLEQSNNVAVKGEVKTVIHSDRKGNSLNENIVSEYVYTYTIESKPVNIVFRKIDEYLEIVDSPQYGKAYKCYVLYAVANRTEKVRFDNVSFSYKYGFSALWRSALVPGFGQIYKGNKTKGICIMSGEVVMIGGIIFCENMRSQNLRKSKETLNIDKVKAHINNADNYATGRNIFIGGASALYVYNLIDAVVSDGRKRTITNNTGLSIIPTVSSDYGGVSLVLNF